MKLLSYNGEAPRRIRGAGLFTTGTALPVDDHIAASFDTPDGIAQGWTVRDIPPAKIAAADKQKPKPEESRS